MSTSPHPARKLLRTMLTGLLGLVLALTTIGGITAAGVLVTMADSFPAAAPSTPARGWPAPRPAPAGRIAVAVVVGDTGSVVSDALAPYEVFARSATFHVYTVALHREPAVLSGGLWVLPEHTMAEVDAGTAPRPDVIVVPAVTDPTGIREAPLREWLVRQADRGAELLGVCSGSRVLAAAGVLDGHRATSFWADLGDLGEEYPAVEWIAGERYVEDGAVTTTAGVTSGVVGALRLVERLAGAAEAERVGREIGYPDWSLGASTTIAVNRLTLADLPYGLNAAFPWLRPTVGVALTDGIGEIEVAAALEVQGGTSFAARTVAIADADLVTSQHGMVLLPARGDSVQVDRVVMPGGKQTGEFSFDPALRDLALHADRATARTTAKFTEYPADHLRLAGAAWPWRPSILCALTLLLGTGVGMTPTIVARRLRRRAERHAVG